jgi:hypothetical protein
LRTIEINVDRQGRTKVETKGFTGVSCREASRFVQEALGQKTADHLTPEYFQTQDVRQDLRQKS